MEMRQNKGPLPQVVQFPSRSGGELFYKQNPSAILFSKALGISIFVIGIILANQPVQLAGLILFGHSSMDRILGYGLKYSDSFQHTHLGMIGRV
jgi:hypothetical protein